jgi:hypothetical protein
MKKRLWTRIRIFFSFFVYGVPVYHGSDHGYFGEISPPVTPGGTLAPLFYVAFEVDATRQLSTW